MEADPKIGICQSKLLSLEDHRHFDSAGDLIDRLGVAIRRGGDLKEVDIGQYNQVEPIFSARGAAMIVQRNVIQKAGSFDPLFAMNYTDLDLCWRARLMGYEIIYVPTSIVYHVGEGSTVAPISAFYSTRNRIALLIKNYGFLNLIRYAPMSFLINVFVTIIEFLQQKPQLVLFRIKGTLSFLSNFRHFWKTRLHVQYRIRRVSDKQILKYMSRHHLAISHWLPLYLRNSRQRSQIESKNINENKF